MGLNDNNTSCSRAGLRLRALFLSCAASVTVAACGGGGNGDATGAAAGPTADGGAAPPPPAASLAPTPPAPPPGPSPAPAPAPSPAPAPAAVAPVAGNLAGACAVAAGGQPRNVSQPTTVVGTGTPASCTSAVVVAAVANGGAVTFNCGADPVTITMAATARVFNNKPDLVLDGGGKVTLSGGGARRILYHEFS